MSMTPASTEYFEEHAGEWDSLRAGYFGEEVREAAIAKAYLRSEYIVADVGAGTGFISAGLAPLVKQVHVIDGSPAMLDVARRDLARFDNLVFHLSDGLSIPLPDGEMDAVFANMYLHHAPDPLRAIREMARLLRPGGRLLITDMDAHTHTWLRDEMADVWLGFERSQVKGWLRQAGLANLIVDSTGQACSSESQSQETSDGERVARISIFLAVGSLPLSGMRQEVQEHYAALAVGQGCGCSPQVQIQDSAPAINMGESCCSPSGDLISLDELTVGSYSPAERLAVPQETADFSLGCGNPIAMAGLREGETVLDIGSGGGLDALLAAQRVGPSGKVIGVDMTPEMLERARRAASKAGLSQVEFRQGQAEALPVEDGSVDVIISNCVINLVEDKGLVFEEVYRALRPGGRLEVSDVLTDRAFSAQALREGQDWASCLTGALPEGEYLDLVRQAGFGEIRVQRSPESPPLGGVRVYSAHVSARK